MPIVKNTLLHIAFSAILPAGCFVFSLHIKIKRFFPFRLFLLTLTVLDVLSMKTPYCMKAKPQIIEIRKLLGPTEPDDRRAREKVTSALGKF